MVNARCGVFSKARLASLLLVLACFSPGFVNGQTKLMWKVKPSYESGNSPQTAFSIPDETGAPRVLYSESYAVLIVEGNYLNKRWPNVAVPGNRNELLLRSHLESRGFHVVVWKDLTGDELHTTMADVQIKLGYRLNSRLFFYFYGHGYTINLQPDPNQKRTFLIPVDASDPVDETEFYQTAYPIRDIVNFAENLTVKHAFLALEACQAGEILALIGLGDPLKLPHPNGYVLSESVNRPVRQFLTAGSANEYVLAQSPFTPLLLSALEQGDGYVTGSEVISFVKRKVAQAMTGQEPDSGTAPINNYGDFIFGPAVIGSTPRIYASSTAEPIRPRVVSPPITAMAPPPTIKPTTGSQGQSTSSGARTYSVLISNFGTAWIGLPYGHLYSEDSTIEISIPSVGFSYIYSLSGSFESQNLDLPEGKYNVIFKPHIESVTVSHFKVRAWCSSTINVRHSISLRPELTFWETSPGVVEIKSCKFKEGKFN